MQPGRNEESNEAAAGLLSPAGLLFTRRLAAAATGTTQRAGSGLPKASHPEEHASSSGPP